MRPNCLYLVSNEVLDQIAFFFHTVLRILICRPCGTSFTPGQVPGHVRRIHGINMFSLEDFQKTCVELRVHTDTDSVVHPAPRCVPVEGIPYDEGLACSVAPKECSYACHNVKHMQSHVRGHAERPLVVSQGFRNNVSIQTLFANVGKKFYEVIPVSASADTSNPFLAALLSDFIPNLPPPPVTGPDTERERTPFIRLMNWDKRMEHIRTDPTKHAALKRLLAPASDSEPELVHLKTIISTYLKRGGSIGWNCNQKFAVRKHLIQGEHLSAL